MCCGALEIVVLLFRVSLRSSFFLSFGWELACKQSVRFGSVRFGSVRFDSVQSNGGGGVTVVSVFTIVTGVSTE